MKSFLLKNKVAKLLYDKVSQLPIYDFHCHLSCKEILENRPYKNLTEIWLSGDHYKWRQMRTFGISEHYITGEASDYDKFNAYCKVMEEAAGNPLNHWSHLELRKYFGIEDFICEKNAYEIWEKSCRFLSEHPSGPADFIKQSNVDTLCIIEDPFCDLSLYAKVNKVLPKVKVLPAFRGDCFLNIQSPAYVSVLEKLGVNINQCSWNDISRKIENKIEEFVLAGSVTADFAFEELKYFDTTENELNQIVSKRVSGKMLEEIEVHKYAFAILETMMKKCYASGLVVQLHIGAKRDNNKAMFSVLKTDSGFDSISLCEYFSALQNLLDRLNNNKTLGKTIIFNLNPNDNDAIITLMGCFQENSRCKGKVQLGAAWWFNDTLDGNLSQIKSMARLSLLSVSVGMLTDSRSFVSYPRHDYYRRILCSFLGEMYENGEYFGDLSKLTEIVQNISFYNAKSYFAKS